VKETLNTQSRNGEAWNEFLKCLDMYAQEILSRSEMLQLVEDLFGKLTDLFDEFKRVLSASGSSEVHHDDTWYVGERAKRFEEEKLVGERSIARLRLAITARLLRSLVCEDMMFEGPCGCPLRGVRTAGSLRSLGGLFSR